MCIFSPSANTTQDSAVRRGRVTDRKKGRLSETERRRINRTFSLVPGDRHYLRLGPVFWLAVDLPRAFPCASTVAYCGVVRLTAAGRCAGLAENQRHRLPVSPAPRKRSWAPKTARVYDELTPSPILSCPALWSERQKKCGSLAQAPGTGVFFAAAVGAYIIAPPLSASRTTDQIKNQISVLVLRAAPF